MKIPKLKNSNETLWLTFTHCVVRNFHLSCHKDKRNPFSALLLLFLAFPSFILFLFLNLTTGYIQRDLLLCGFFCKEILENRHGGDVIRFEYRFAFPRSRCNDKKGLDDEDTDTTTEWEDQRLLFNLTADYSIRPPFFGRRQPS